MKLCGFDIGLNQPFFLIAGPCVVESEQLQMDTAGRSRRSRPRWAFRSSSRAASTRPTGRRAPASAARAGKGLEIMAKVKRELGLPR
jgi:2-dehydro-3-deoxyphosphooctonate aldolase (KDO 8-P synthase)